VALALVNYLGSLRPRTSVIMGLQTAFPRRSTVRPASDPTTWSEPKPQAILGALVRLGDAPSRTVQTMLLHARQRFPHNPFLPYFELIHAMGDTPEKTTRRLAL